MRFLIGAAALAALAPTLAPVLASAEVPDTPIATVSPLVVTRLPTALPDAPDATVIDRAEIDLRQATFAADVLNQVPGLALTRTGAFGGVTSLRIRGASADKTLVLIDGVPQDDPSQPAGNFDFGALDLADIERIEILQGPQGALWGSDAIGGVVAFTTRELNGWRGQVEGGSLNTVDGSAAVGARTDAWALGASVSGYRSDGISKADGFPERDPFRSWTAGGYARVRLSSAISLDGRLRFTDSRVNTDGYDPNTFAFGDTPEFATYRSWSGSARARIDGPLGFRHTLTFGAYDISRANLGTATPSTFVGNRRDYRWMAERGDADAPWGLAVGVDRETTRASLSTGDTLDLGTTSAFAVARVRPFAALRLTGSVRYDAPKSFAAQTTGRVGGVLDLGAGFSLQATWGQGFKTPSISETACDFCFPEGLSVGLKPEHAEGWDAGLAWRSADGRFVVRVTGYQLDVRDQIAFASSFPFRYINIDHTRASGVEVQAEAQLTPHLRLQAGYGFTDARDIATGDPLVRIPRNAGSVAIYWTSARWQAAFTVRSESADADIDPASFSPATRPGFTVADLSGAYTIRPGIEITARIENLTDARYNSVLGYGEPGRMAFVGLRLKG